MATIRKEISIAADPAAVWDAVRDVGEVHRRLTPGVTVAAHLDGDARVVTFASGLVVRELVVALDDHARRFSYAAVGGRATHHNASMEVLADGAGSRLVWTTDVLPHELAPLVTGLVEQASAVIKATLEQG